MTQKQIAQMLEKQAKRMQGCRPNAGRLAIKSPKPKKTKHRNGRKSKLKEKKARIAKEQRRESYDGCSILRVILIVNDAPLIQVFRYIIGAMPVTGNRYFIGRPSQTWKHFADPVTKNTTVLNPKSPWKIK